MNYLVYRWIPQLPGLFAFCPILPPPAFFEWEFNLWWFPDFTENVCTHYL